MLTGFIPMVDELERRGTGYTGTLNNIGTSYPVWLEQSHSKLTRERQGPGGMEKMVLAWRDKGKPTIMMSSVHVHKQGMRVLLFPSPRKGQIS